MMKNETKADVKDFVYVAVGVAALGGLLFGYDTGVISGAILFIKTQFSLSSAMEEIVVSAVLVGAVIGAVIGGALTDRFGRRGLIIVAGIIFTVSAIGTTLSPTVTLLIVARVASGIAIGIASFISPMYIAELVPAKVRGSSSVRDRRSGLRWHARHRCGSAAEKPRWPRRPTQCGRLYQSCSSQMPGC